jgi:hypothetical protein
MGPTSVASTGAPTRPAVPKKLIVGREARMSVLDFILNGAPVKPAI